MQTEAERARRKEGGKQKHLEAKKSFGKVESGLNTRLEMWEGLIMDVLVGHDVEYGFILSSIGNHGFI